MTHQPPNLWTQWAYARVGDGATARTNDTTTERALERYAHPSCLHIPPGPIPWDALSRVGLAGYVSLALSRAGDKRGEAHQHAAHRTLLANLLRVQSVRGFGEALDHAHVPWLLIKGAATIVRYPPLMGARPMGDIDLLVRPSAYHRAARVLSDAGFREVDLALPISRFVARERVFQRETDAGVIEIDLHRALHHGPLDGGLSEAAIQGRVYNGAVPIPWHGHGVLIAAVHRARSGFDGQGPELLDARLALDALSDGDWTALLRDASSIGLRPLLAVLLRQILPWFGLLPREHMEINTVPQRRTITGEPLDALVERAARDGRDALPRTWVERWPFTRAYIPFVLAGPRPLAAALGIGVHALLRTTDLVWDTLHAPARAAASRQKMRVRRDAAREASTRARDLDAQRDRETDRKTDQGGDRA